MVAIVDPKGFSFVKKTFRPRVAMQHIERKKKLVQEK